MLARIKGILYIMFMKETLILYTYKISLESFLIVAYEMSAIYVINFLNCVSFISRERGQWTRIGILSIII